MWKKLHLEFHIVCDIFKYKYTEYRQKADWIARDGEKERMGIDCLMSRGFLLGW